VRGAAPSSGAGIAITWLWGFMSTIRSCKIGNANSLSNGNAVDRKIEGLLRDRCIDRNGPTSVLAMSPLRWLLLEEFVEKRRRFIRDANDFVRCLTIKFKIELSPGLAVIPVGAMFEFAPP